MVEIKSCNINDTSSPVVQICIFCAVFMVLICGITLLSGSIMVGAPIAAIARHYTPVPSARWYHATARRFGEAAATPPADSVAAAIWSFFN